MIAFILILVAGALSAATYLWRRRWIDAALISLAAGALAAIVGAFPMPAELARTVAIAAGDPLPSIEHAAAVSVQGDGLRAAQWHDLPARPLQWTAPASEVIRLDFPQQLTRGRTFSLTARRNPGSAWRLQLLAENKQLLAEANGSGAALTVQWLPPVAETLVLQARLLDGAGKVLAEGPIPFEVREPVPLQVHGRFSAPSFDARALNELLVNSHAIIDWQVVLGKTVTRNETARATMSRPDLLVVDAAYVERLAEGARNALLAQVAGGAPLVILASNAGERALWARLLQLELKEQGEVKPLGAPLALTPAPLNPAAPTSGPWSGGAGRVWSRAWGQGRIVWLGVSDWHRFAISEPRALGLWWQDVLDRAGVRRDEETSLLAQDEMPLPGQRLAVCALGVKGDVAFPDLKQTLSWQRRADRADAACVAVWPHKAGWLRMTPQIGQVYVYAAADWPLWQKAQRRDATAVYAARTPVAPVRGTVPMPAWPFALVFAAAMLALWWRERRQ